MGEAEILSTPHGRILKSLINDGVRVGISSRGVGNGKVDENGILVIGESYKLITFDAVADPSTFAAFQEKVVNGTKREVYIPNFSNNQQKNEGRCMISKEAMIACLGGLIETNKKKIIGNI